MSNSTPTGSVDELQDALDEYYNQRYHTVSESENDGRKLLEQLILAREEAAMGRALSPIDKISYPPSGKEYWFKDGTFENSLTGAVRKAMELQSLPNTKEVFCMKVEIDNKVPANGIRFDHPDGRAEGFIMPNTTKEG